MLVSWVVCWAGRLIQAASGRSRIFGAPAVPKRCGWRARAWRQHAAQTRFREAALERLTAATQHAAKRRRSRTREKGYWLEL